MAAYIGSPRDVAIELDAKDQQLATDRVERALRRATNQLVSALGWDPRQSDRVHRVTGQRRVFLPAMRVTAAAVTTPVGWPGTVAFTDVGVVDLGAHLVGALTYTAGWAPEEMPEVLADVVVEWAADRLDSTRRLRSWSTGNEAETYAVVPGAVGDADTRLDPYRLPPALA